MIVTTTVLLVAKFVTAAKLALILTSFNRKVDAALARFLASAALSFAYPVKMTEAPGSNFREN
jgi:hypothetical protein